MAGEAAEAPAAQEPLMSRRRLSAGATFAAVGVVSGDIGTSPLYALQQSLGATDGDANSPATVLDVLSLMFWSLLVVARRRWNSSAWPTSA